MSFINTIEMMIYRSQKKIGILELLEFIAFCLIVYKYNPFNISSKYPLYSQIAVLIVGFIYVVLFFFIRHHFIDIDDLFDIGLKRDVGLNKPSETDFLWRIIGTFLIILGFIILTVFIVWLFRTKHAFIKVFKYSIFSLLVGGIIGIILLLNTNLISKFAGPNKIINLIKKLLLFVPCLLLSFIDYIRHEYSITTKPIWILLFMEFILILLWLGIPLFTSYAVNKYGTNLLNNPVYLNNQTNLGSFESLHASIAGSASSSEAGTEESDISTKKFNYNYAISAWFTINPQPPNTRAAYTKYTTILNYGNKPSVEYNSEKRSLRITTESGLDTAAAPAGLAPAALAPAMIAEIYETKNIIMQKWNNIVINYDGGTMDVFLNGELVGSKPNIMPYMTYENIVVGEDRGLEGGICNVVYYDHILSNRTINLIYNALKEKKIPIF
jgi:hypothetical protein